MVTIADVARVAGVSRSTVSYALSGKRAISEETQARIQAAIGTLGFTVNAGARALATHRTMVIGLMLQFEPDEFAPAMLQYVLPITEAAREAGFDTLLVTDQDQAGSLRRITESGMVDGVVLLDVTQDDVRLPILRKARQPGVVFGLPRDTAGVDVIDLDFSSAGRAAVEHLVDRGHRRILLVTPSDHVFERGGTYASRFRAGAVDHAAFLGVELHVSAGAGEREQAAERITAILDSEPAASALIIHNDATVVQLQQVLDTRRSAGIAVPDVISIYPREFARDFMLKFAYIDTAPDMLSRMAVRTLVNQIAQGDQRRVHQVQFCSPELRG